MECELEDRCTSRRMTMLEFEHNARELAALFVIYAHVHSDKTSFQIRTVKLTHECSRTMNHNLASARYLALKYLDDFKSDTYAFKAVTFQEKVHQDLNVNISKWTAYRALREAKRVIHGRYDEQYELLHSYCAELRRSNPGSTVKLDTYEDFQTRQQHFRRIYVCLAALRAGFIAGCMKLVGLDGIFLKGPHTGVLLTAVGIDANNGMFPVAYAVCDDENMRTWSWFIQSLVQDLQMYDQEHWCIISDRQKGLIQAVKEHLPRVEHRFCVRHLHNNMKILHMGEKNQRTDLESYKSKLS